MPWTDALWTAASFLLGHLVPKDPDLFVFGGRQYGGNTAPVFERVAEAGRRGVWLTARAEILASGRPGVLSTRSWAGLWAAARAGAVVLTHSLGDFGPLVLPSRRTRVFNLWHGMPIKRISTADPRFHSRSYAKGNLREMARFEAMFATSPAMADLFARTFRLRPEQVHLTGQPRTDVLFHPPAPDFLDRYDPPLPPHSRRVLHCPTWREGTPVRLFPFADHDLAALETLLEELDAVLMVRTHPNDPGRLAQRGTRVVPMQGDVAPEVTDVLPHFDALITDYSSVYYDFLMLDRPTVFLPYDLAEYREAPGFYLPFEDIVSGPCPGDFAAFCAALREALTTPEHHAEARARIRALVYDHVDDQATTRVLQVVARPRRR
ncbi:MAG: CDP-glycerol glycerophosphotransferase family protein [Myxococcales bacterium]|nr:CDP-glycerol glycerophosphotransferase family protein [Myxococcales bacterium]